jgi:hypothetical protein
VSISSVCVGNSDGSNDCISRILAYSGSTLLQAFGSSSSSGTGVGSGPPVENKLVFPAASDETISTLTLLETMRRRWSSQILRINWSHASIKVL